MSLLIPEATLETIAYRGSLDMAVGAMRALEFLDLIWFITDRSDFTPAFACDPVMPATPLSPRGPYHRAFLIIPEAVGPLKSGVFTGTLLRWVLKSYTT